ncbi:MAG: N-acetylneuraminate synthase family protein [Oscillospiraceae bacterium]
MSKFFDKTFVIAEIAQTHDGSLGVAHSYIDAVAKTGANAIKFQTHIASEESTMEEPWRIKFSQQDASRYDYWKRMEFSFSHWKDLKAHAEEKGLIFMSSPFSVKAAELLNEIDIEIWKISSGEITNPWLLEYVISTKKPIILSTGMSMLNEIDLMVDYLKKKGVEFALLQCTTKYPVKPEEIGLNMLTVFGEKYGIPVGLSDHSGTIIPSLAAATLGAKVIETHVCMSKEDFGPDVLASVTTTELKQMVDGIRAIEQIISHPIDKDEISKKLMHTNLIFSKSVCAKRYIKKGTILTQDMIALKKPGKGIPANQIDKALGKKLCVEKNVDEFISLDEVEEV